jgi:MoaA/NifB/PqqE/SkfB family radical SAM enzyme
MKNIAVVESNQSKIFNKFIYWYIGDKCNYRCSYCHPNYYSGKHGWHSADVVVPFLNQFQNSCVIFSGGEPTYHPELFDIFKNISPTISVGLVSNGSRPWLYWEQLIKIRYTTNIIFSYHYAEVNEQEFFETALALHQSDRCSIAITFLLPTENDANGQWDRSVEFYNKLKSTGINIQPKLRFEKSEFVAGRPDSGLPVDSNYSPAQLAWAHTENSKLKGGITLYDSDMNVITKEVDSQYLISRDITNFVGWKCFAPKTNMLIAPNGDVTTGLCAQRQNLGNIFDKVNIASNQYDICRTPGCTGWIDVIALKSAIK